MVARILERRLGTFLVAARYNFLPLSCDKMKVAVKVYVRKAYESKGGRKCEIKAT